MSGLQPRKKLRVGKSGQFAHVQLDCLCILPRYPGVLGVYVGRTAGAGKGWRRSLDRSGEFASRDERLEATDWSLTVFDLVGGVGNRSCGGVSGLV